MTYQDEDVAFMGRAALLVGALAVTAGVLGMAALIAAGAWVVRRRPS